MWDSFSGEILFRTKLSLFAYRFYVRRNSRGVVKVFAVNVT